MYVDILSPAPPSTVNGRVVSAYVRSRIIRIGPRDFQPLKNQIVLGVEGVTNRPTHLLICKDFDIKEVDRVKVNGMLYKINSLVPFDGHHNEVYLEKVI